MEIYGSSDVRFKVGFLTLRINTITEYKRASERDFERYKGMCVFEHDIIVQNIIKKYLTNTQKCDNVIS